MAAAGTFTIYSANKDDLNPNDVLAATVKIALITSAYTPDTATGGHSIYANVSANEIAAGNGYSAGGIALSSKQVTAITSGWKFSSANVVWTATGGNIPAWRYAVMYVEGSLWSLTNPLIGYFIGDSAPADVPATTSGNPLTLTTPANGWFDVV